MIVLTGLFEGEPEENYYGRIIRVKENGGNVIQIMEYKDILALPDDRAYTVTFQDREYTYTKEELINIKEYNSGVFAFRYGKLVEMIGELKSDNVQKEIYLTDLISLFNEKGYAVAAASPKKNYVVMGFNTKEVLKQMEDIARKIIYEKLKHIVEFEDPDDFFIHENVVGEIIKKGDENVSLNLTIGKGDYINKDYKLEESTKID